MKYCSKCGAELNDEAVVCVKCGCAVETIEKTEKKRNVFALLGFIFSFLIPIVGLVLGILGLNEAKQSNDGKGLSKAAICISTVTMVFEILAVVITVFSMFSIHTVS